MKFDLKKVKQFIDAQGPETKIYIGCDSIRYRKWEKWYADYTLAIVVHIDGKHGCKIFGEVQTELDYDQQEHLPALDKVQKSYKLRSLT